MVYDSSSVQSHQVYESAQMPYEVAVPVWCHFALTGLHQLETGSNRRKLLGLHLG